MSELTEDLLNTSLGLFSNAQNPNFKPSPETIMKWSNLTFAAYKEIYRLCGEVHAADLAVAKMHSRLRAEALTQKAAVSPDDPSYYKNHEPACAALAALEDGMQNWPRACNCRHSKNG